jgi:hypothetical protein
MLQCLFFSLVCGFFYVIYRIINLINSIERRNNSKKIDDDITARKYREIYDAHAKRWPQVEAKLKDPNKDDLKTNNFSNN